MAILNIALMGNKGLKRIADPVEDPTAPEIAELAGDMRETLENISSSGIAAPQVFVSKRIFVYRIVERLIPPGSKMKPIPWRVLINPVLEPLSDEKMPIGYEKCLSLPGLHGEVPRYTRVRIQAPTTRRLVHRDHRRRLPRPAVAARVRPPGRHPLSPEDAGHLQAGLRLRAGRPHLHAPRPGAVRRVSAITSVRLRSGRASSWKPRFFYGNGLRSRHGVARS